MSYVVAPQGSYAYTVSHVNNILWDDTHLCPAHALTPDEAEQFGVRPLTETPKPDFDPATQAVDEIDPAPVAGIWTQQWAIRAATQAEMDAYAAEQAGQQAWTSSGTFTVPAGVTSICGLCIGAGGNGRSAVSGIGAGGGGGGGADGTLSTGAANGGAGGAYGGGGGGGDVVYSGGNGGAGAVRIICGAGRSYSSTNTGDV